MCVTVVLCVSLVVKDLGVNEAQSIQARIHRGGAVGLIRHQSIVTVTYPAIHLQTQRNVYMYMFICNHMGLGAVDSPAHHFAGKRLAVTAPTELSAL